MKADFDVAIVGSGFGGSLLAMVLRQLGRSVVLVERGRHPRFAIGESTSPLMNLLIEELADRYDLPAVAPLTSYGAWRRTYPDVIRGLKRGFTFFHHASGREYSVAPRRANQLLVAASPNDDVADTHWLRADVDHFLVRHAVERGAELAESVVLDRFEPEPSGGARLSGTRDGAAFSVRTRLVVDATGPRGFMSRALRLAEAPLPTLPPTETLFSHFVDVERCDAMPQYAVDAVPPYPLDDAAVHHVFDGGWMWVLRFDNGVTSAGISVTRRRAADLQLSDGEPAWHRFLARYPTVRAQFAGARAIREFSYAPRPSYRTSAACGDGWILLPSCAAFVDPLFSTGMPLTLLGIERIGRAVERDWGTDRFGASLAEVGRITLDEADHTAGYVGACFAAMRDLEVFAPLSMFYFTAASFSETARRLDAPATPSRFLALDRERFTRGLHAAVRRVHTGKAFAASGRFERSIACAVDSTNVAGLCDPSKDNWYGVDLEDVVRGAAKLGVSDDLARDLVRLVEAGGSGMRRRRLAAR